MIGRVAGGDGTSRREGRFFIIESSVAGGVVGFWRKVRRIDRGVGVAVEELAIVAA